MEIEVTILNWEKYQQGRKDVTNPTWFRTNVGMWRCQSLFGFSVEEKWVWFCLLSFAAEKNDKTVTIVPGWFSRECGVDQKVFESSIDKLSRNGDVTATSRPRDVNVTLQTDITDITDRQTRQTKKKSVAVKITAPPTEVCLENFVFNLSPEARDRIQRIYPDQAFVEREVEKMKVWLGANPKKSPKSVAGWTRFVMGWLERGWERYRKTIASAQGGRGRDVFDEINWDRVFKRGNYAQGTENESAVVSRADKQIE